MFKSRAKEMQFMWNYRKTDIMHAQLLFLNPQDSYSTFYLASNFLNEVKQLLDRNRSKWIVFHHLACTTSELTWLKLWIFFTFLGVAVTQEGWVVGCQLKCWWFNPGFPTTCQGVLRQCTVHLILPVVCASLNGWMFFVLQGFDWSERLGKYHINQ